MTCDWPNVNSSCFNNCQGYTIISMHITNAATTKQELLLNYKAKDKVTIIIMFK